MKQLAKFEKKHTKTEEISASTLKMFVVQLINTGVIIVIVNADFSLAGLPNDFPVFNGEYPDFDLLWYKNIGTTIALTMIISIVTPHLGNFGFMILNGMKRCCDRGCGFNKKVTKKLLQEDYD